jgi:hypothetical protein
VDGKRTPLRTGFRTGGTLCDEQSQVQDGDAREGGEPPRGLSPVHLRHAATLTRLGEESLPAGT